MLHNLRSLGLTMKKEKSVDYELCRRRDGSRVLFGCVARDILLRPRIFVCFTAARLFTCMLKYEEKRISHVGEEDKKTQERQRSAFPNASFSILRHPASPLFVDFGWCLLRLPRLMFARELENWGTKQEKKAEQEQGENDLRQGERQWLKLRRRKKERNKTNFPMPFSISY